jgi:hypothetical protein
MQDKGSASNNNGLLMFNQLIPGLLCISVVFVLLLLTAHAEASDSIGKFTSVQGKVDILKAGKLPAAPVRTGNPVFEKDIIRTKSDSRAEITFADGNIVKIAQRSRIDISEYTADAEQNKGIVKLSRGKAEAIVPEKIVRRITDSPNANRFEIHTPNAVAGVRGTDYIVFHHRNVTVVIVRSGIVHVFNPQFPDTVVPVAAGNLTIVYHDKPPLPQRPATEEEMRISLKDILPGEMADNEFPILADLPGASSMQQQPETPSPENMILTITETPSAITDVAEPQPLSEFDRTPPQISLSSSAFPQAGTNLSTINIGISSNESASYSYSLDGGAWTQTGNILTLPNLTEGTHTIDYNATDVAGNISAASLPFSLKHQTVAGNVAGSGSVLTGTSSGDVSLVSGKTWGGWQASLNGTYTGAHSSSWQIISGGDGKDSSNAWNGYWVNKVAGNYSGATMTGTADFLYLSCTSLGKGTGTVSGSYDSTNSTWQMTVTGTFADTPLIFPDVDYSGSTSADSLLNSGTGSFPATGGTIASGAGSKYTTRLLTPQPPWGLWQTTLGGTFTGTPDNAWNLSVNADTPAPDCLIRMETTGSQWSDSLLSGKTTGYWAKTDSSPETGIYIGETLGTFNPNDYTWHAIQTGAWINSPTLLDMASTADGRNSLQQLNIPAVEVGKTTLSGALIAGPMGSTDHVSVSLNDVIFLAPSTGQKPAVWATDSVTGQYSFTNGYITTGNITNTNNMIPLSNGNGLDAEFQFTQWNTANSTWRAAVNNGTGTLSGGSYTGTVNFNGAASGTHTGTALSGTAAGIVK